MDGLLNLMEYAAKNNDYELFERVSVAHSEKYVSGIKQTIDFIIKRVELSQKFKKEEWISDLAKSDFNIYVDGQTLEKYENGYNERPGK